MMKTRFIGLIKPTIAILFTIFFISFIFSSRSLFKVGAQSANEAFVYIEGPDDPGSDGSTYRVMINSGANHVAFARVVLTFDQSLVNLSSEVYANLTDLNTNLSKTTMADANSSGQIIIESVFYPGTNETSTDSPTGVFEIASLDLISITSETNIQTSLSFSEESMQLASPDYSGQEMQILTTNKDLVLNNISPTPSQSEATITLSLQNQQNYIGSDITADVNLSTNTPVSGVDVALLFDQNHLRVESVTPNNIMGGFDTSSIGTGIVRISQTSGVDTGFSGSGKIATIHITPLLTGSSSLDFIYISGATHESNVIEFATGFDILLEPSNLTIEVSVRPKMIISLETESLNGYQNYGTLSLGDGKWDYDFLIDDQGSSEEFDIPEELVGLQVPFYVKIPGYLVRKVVINIKTGLNQLDAGKLVAGDINGDGIINTIDLSQMYLVWYGTGVSDFNGNGIVQSDDHSILIRNFFKQDET